MTIFKMSIIKPNSSRPANSERYFVCSNLRRDSVYKRIKKHLWTIVRWLWKIKDINEIDIVEIVPLHILKTDTVFNAYILASNNDLAIKQTIGLKKLATFCRNPNLVEFRQEELRKKSLQFWKIPDKSRTALPQLTASQYISLVLDKPDILLVQPKKVDHIKAFNEVISDIEDWYYLPLYSSQTVNNCNIYAGVTGKVYRLQKGKWVKIKNVQLSRGTIVYAEFVKEKCVTKEGNKNSECIMYSLHIIDALYLGEKILTDLTFLERQELIKQYCKSINKESQPLCVRIRNKIMDKLVNISSNCLITFGKDEGIYSKLPLLGFKSMSETFSVNSLLCLKVNSNQSFPWVYVLRVQIFIKNNEENNDESLLLEDIISEVKQKA